MAGKMVDVEVHIDELLDQRQRAALLDKLLQHAGVIDVGGSDKTPHLLVIEYNPDQVNSTQLLHLVESQGLHAELFGL